MRHWRPLLAFAAVEIAMPWVLLARAEKQLTSSLTGLLIAAVPLVGAVIAPDGDASGSARRRGSACSSASSESPRSSAWTSAGQRGALVEIGLVAVCYAVGPIILSRSLTDLPASA